MEFFTTGSFAYPFWWLLAAGTIGAIYSSVYDRVDTWGGKWVSVLCYALALTVLTELSR